MQTNALSKLVIAIRDLPPMPRNRSHQVANKMLIKTDLCRAFEADLTKRLEEFRDRFRFFAELVQVDKHYIAVLYRIYTPAELLFTKDGRISLKATDWDAHKVFQDTLFRSMGLDDKLVRDGRVITPVSKSGKWDYEITLQLEETCKLTQEYQTPSEDSSLL